MSRSRIDGGAPARRAIVRWSWRLTRRDWRQHVMILVLLSLAVAATVFFSSGAYNIAPAAGRAEFGDAEQILFLVADPSPAVVADWLADGQEAFGTIDPVGHRSVTVPGLLAQLDYRAQAVDGPFSEPILSLVSGRAPGEGEVAITDGVADLLSLDIGDVIAADGRPVGETLDFDGVARVIVGIVENPSRLDDEFVLLPVSEIASSETVTMLLKTSDDGFQSFRGGDEPIRVALRADVREDVLAGVLMLLACTVLLLLVGLVASASFTVIAQRRLPQLGMLSAVGASERHLRLSVLAGGLLTGIAAAVIGTVAGVAGWLAVVPLTESIVQHRVDRSNIPWWIVVAAALLAVAAAGAAAWWPARKMSRIPTVMALSGRTPRPVAPHRSALLAVALLAAGGCCLYWGSGFDDGPSMTDLVLLSIGTLAVIAGVLLVSPVAVRALGRVANRLPIASRLALRDLSRHQPRSSAALAAIGLALGIPAVIAAATAAAENASPLGNLSATQVLVQPDEFLGPFAPDAEELDLMASGVDEVAEALGSPSALSLDTFRDPEFPLEPGTGRGLMINVDRQVDDGWEYVDSVFAATPEMLDALGLDESAVESGTVVTDSTGDLWVRGMGRVLEPPRREGEQIVEPGTLPDMYTSLPSALLDADAGLAKGWEVVPSGRWLIQNTDGFTDEQLDAARQVAAGYGLAIENRDERTTLPRLRLIAGLVGMLLALGVLATTVGLIRGESAGDLRTLAATGAEPALRRRLAAVTAGTLALIGAALGIGAAYIGLIAARVDHLTPLPWRDLAMIAVATPLLAAGGAWLLAGREPQAIARTPLD
jgi:putative ABC transport system permease protein